MKICRFLFEDEIKFGVLEGDSIICFNDIDEIFNAKNASSVAMKQRLKTSEVAYLASAAPSKIVCVGRNYAEHAAELGNEVPKEPLLFLKAPSSIITENESILIPPQSNQIEHEGELAVIIGRACKNLGAQDNPLDYVLGYTCLNDVTARDLQRQDVQFTRAKSFDTFCPLGTFIETDADVSDLRVTTKVNGEIRQSGRTAQMIFPIAYLINYISKQMTLEAGDVVATGTPAGVSKLNDGDVCEIEIERVGALRNTVKKTII